MKLLIPFGLAGDVQLFRHAEEAGLGFEAMYHLGSISGMAFRS